MLGQLGHGWTSGAIGPVVLVLRVVGLGARAAQASGGRVGLLATRLVWWEEGKREGGPWERERKEELG